MSESTTTNSSLIYHPVVRRFLPVALVLWFCGMFAATHIPFDSDQISSPFPLFDKAVHLALYLGLGGLATLTWSSRREMTARDQVLILLILFAVGAADELLQIPISGRHADVWDWVTDLFGATLGFSIARLALRIPGVADDQNLLTAES
ncbi:VanZ family protein [Calycomorphotria hydatis]|uniref:VanZ like family protein n=1 Tax=Calycomorphotria hydatis TaxID=2528027 RepID=A0A517T870_9PLAN|nr:VanZ family protein [Calycomorphotria hydatis]QDT64573.1 VanZ like family protein [Calycomorphotria hydatis]